MGSFLHPITLIGPEGETALEALVDTGATYTSIPRPILERLGVRPIGKEPFALADGRVVEYEIGALTTVRIDGKERPTICIFGEPNSESLLGVFTLEGCLLGVDPVNKRLIPITGRLKEIRQESQPVSALTSSVSMWKLQGCREW